MGLNPAAILADAWAALRRDRAVLLAVASAFWFLPSFALRLLLPAVPPLPPGVTADSPQAQAWTQAAAAWILTHGWWVVLAGALAAWGTTTVYAFYLDRTRPDLRDALAIGGKIWPRFLLLSLVIGGPALIGWRLWVLPCIWLLARLIAAAPALAAERPLGVRAALGRGWRLSRGATLPLMSCVALVLALGVILPEPLLRLDLWLRTQPGGPNVVAVTIVNAFVSAVGAFATLASTLLAVSAYRALVARGASSGI